MLKNSLKKERIFEATLNLVKEKGFHSMPMSLIAQEASVAAGTIYIYFKNKEELLNQLYLKIKKEYSDALMKGYDKNAPIKDSFELIWRNTLNFQLNRSLEFSYMEQFKNSPFIFKVTISEGIKLFKPAKKIIKRGKKEKIVKNIPNSIINALFFAPLGEWIKQYLHSETVPKEEEISIIFQGCWNALKK